MIFREWRRRDRRQELDAKFLVGKLCVAVSQPWAKEALEPADFFSDLPRVNRREMTDEEMTAFIENKLAVLWGKHP